MDLLKEVGSDVIMSRPNIHVQALFMVSGGPAERVGALQECPTLDPTTPGASPALAPGRARITITLTSKNDTYISPLCNLSIIPNSATCGKGSKLGKMCQLD